MMHRLAAVLAPLSLLLACGQPQGPAATTGSPPTGEFRNTHHALLRGTVVNGAGELLEGVEVAVVRLADPSVASLSYDRTRTDRSGGFTLPVGVIVHAPGETATVQAVVRAAALPPRYPRPSPGAYYTSEITVPVRVVPAGRDPAPVSVRLALPVP